MFRRILLAFDGSPSARCALDQAIRLAEDRDVSLTVIAVRGEPLDWSAGGSYAAPVAQLDGARFERVIHAAVARMPDWLTAEIIVSAGDAAREIVREARVGAHDVIVMGSRGRAGLSSLILGSVSRDVLHISPVPVLVVPLHVGDGVDRPGQAPVERVED